MIRFTTHDGKKISIDVDRDNPDLIRHLTDIIPRLSYDEILDGELEKISMKIKIARGKL
jgi:hypothetical protein